MKPVLPACVGLTAVLAGCSMLSGFNRAGTLAGGLDTACVERTFASVDGLVVVETQERTDKSFEIAPEWGDSTTTSHYWIYNAPGVERAILAVSRMDQKGPAARISHMWGKSDKKDMPEPVARAALGAMLKVEAAIEATCGKHVDYKMSCGVISCKPLESFVKEYTGA